MARIETRGFFANLGLVDYLSPFIAMFLFLIHTKTHLFDYPIVSNVMDILVSPKLWYWIVAAGCFSLALYFLKKNPSSIMRGAIFGGLAGTVFGSAVSAYLFSQSKEAFELFILGVVAYIGHLVLMALVLKKIKAPDGDSIRS